MLVVLPIWLNEGVLFHKSGRSIHGMPSIEETLSLQFVEFSRECRNDAGKPARIEKGQSRHAAKNALRRLPGL